MSIAEQIRQETIKDVVPGLVRENLASTLLGLLVNAASDLLPKYETSIKSAKTLDHLRQIEACVYHDINKRLKKSPQT